jgi:hypothetical protein
VYIEASMEGTELPTTSLRCPVCSKTYLLRHAHTRHILRCRLKRAAQGDQVEPSPPAPQDLYELLASLTGKVELLEKRVALLAARTPLKAHRASHIERLSSTATCAPTLVGWLNGLTVSRLELERVFANPSSGIVEIVEANCTAASSSPFRRFSEPEVPLYVRTPEGWIPVSTAIVERVRAGVLRKLRREFVVWQNEHVHELTNDAFSRTFTGNLLTIVGDNAESGGKVIRFLRSAIAGLAPLCDAPSQ